MEYLLGREDGVPNRERGWSTYYGGRMEYQIGRQDGVPNREGRWST